MKDIIDLLGRIFLSAIFLYDAYDSIYYFDRTKATMTEYGITWQQDLLLVGAIFLLVTGGLMLLVGYRVTVASILLLIYYIPITFRSEEHTSELQSRGHLVCRLLLEKKNKHI